MTTSQKFLISLVILAASYLLLTTGKYWLADVRYAAGSNAVRSFQATQQADYLLAAYKDFTSAYVLKPAEPVIASETAVAAAYLANALRTSDATSAATLAQQSLSLSQLSISISPRHPNYYKSRARAMILLSDLDPRYLGLAAEALAEATRISPTDPRIPYNLGVIYATLGATPSAIQQFAKALSLKPDFADPAKQLQEISSSAASQ